MSASDHEPPPGCTTCGTEAQGGARFCRRCGEPLPGELPPPRASAPAPALSELSTATLDEGAIAAYAAGSDGGGGPRRAEPMLTDRVGRFVPSPSPSHEPEARACPVCPTVNPVERELCVRCGADLETGATWPQPRPSYGDGPSDTIGATRTSRRLWWIAPTAIIAVAVAILAGLWTAGIGPFASEPELPSADFAAERYPVDEPAEPLPLSDIATVTTRPPDGARTFPVEQMVDTDPATAWRSHPPDLPAGVDEKVDLFLEEPAWVTKLVINNGDHADAAAYESVGRIQRAVLVMDGDVRMEIVLLDLGREPQAVSLPEPVLTTTVRLEVMDVLPGEDDGIAISDLELRGWVADATDADIATRRADVRQAAGSFTLPD